MKFIGITLFATGLLIAGSEGTFFPYINLLGAGLLLTGAKVLSTLNDRGLL